MSSSSPCLFFIFRRFRLFFHLLGEQAAAAAEVRGEGEIGEVFGRPLSDFDETPPVLLECMGYVFSIKGGKLLSFLFFDLFSIHNPIYI